MAAREDLDLSRAAWRTSTYSGNGNDCVEVATTWRTSSHSGNGGERVEASATRRTSSHSGPNGGQCVEVAADTGVQVLVRDTKQGRRGQIHRFTAEAWREFIARIKAGETVR